jgi:preprotein translocase subunit Sec61beta
LTPHIPEYRGHSGQKLAFGRSPGENRRNSRDRGRPALVRTSGTPVWSHPDKGERLTRAGTTEVIMSSNSGGLMSSAGLVRYFDAEDTNTIRIDPRTIVAFGLLFGILMLVLNAMA